MRWITILLIMLFFACSPDGENPKPLKQGYASLELVSGNAQSGRTGMVLQEPLEMKVVVRDTMYQLNKFYLTAKVADGNVLGSPNSYFPEKFIMANENGEFFSFWELGCSYPQQSVTFYLFYLDSCYHYSAEQEFCVPIDSTSFQASASTPSGWNRACGIKAVDSYNTRILSVDGALYAINYGILYRAETSDAMVFKKADFVPTEDIFDVGITSTGRIYLLTGQEGIYFSDDFVTWTLSNKGILDRRYPLDLLVEDSVIYASFMFDGLYRLRSTSDFWEKLLIDGKYHEEYMHMTRHPNGDLYLLDKWDEFWVSNNSGDNWEHLPIESKYARSEVEEIKIDQSGYIYIGSGDATFAVISPEAYQGDFYTYYQWNASSQHVNNIIFRGGEVYYLVNFTPNPGIYSSKQNWQKEEIGFEKNISLFEFNTDGSFILGANDGIYYFKN